MRRPVTPTAAGGEARRSVLPVAHAGSGAYQGENVEPLCTVRMLGGFRLEGGSMVLTRLRTRKAGSLLAYLAYFKNRPHPREVLADTFWPDSDPDAGRKSLSVALSEIRRHIEPDGTHAGEILHADRLCVQLDPALVSTDVAAFNAAFRSAHRAETDEHRVRYLTSCVDRYTGPLLPGHYDGWIPAEQARLSDRWCAAARDLALLIHGAGATDRAIALLRACVARDPLCEELHLQLIRLYAANGQAAGALRQFADLEAALAGAYDARPSSEALALIASLRSRSDTAPPTVRSPPTGEDGGSEPLQSRAAVSASETCRALPKRVQRSGLARVDLSSALPLTRFFGRECEIRQLIAMTQAEGTRLITVTGAGGCGKTRLALQALGAAHDRLDRPVHFISLAHLSDTSTLHQRILAHLQPCGDAAPDALVAVADLLEAAPAILILDNFEHLTAAGAPMVRTLLTRVPSTICVVTSRQRLNLSGEEELWLAPLDIPDEECPLERLEQYACVQLFVDRARSARPDFRLTPRNERDVCRLSRQLEGLPLAIELAASHAQALTPLQMIARMEDRFGFLVGRGPETDARHSSMREVMDASYLDLSPQLRTALIRLAHARGDWSADTAVAALHADAQDPLPILMGLRDWSLLFAREVDDEMVFRMPESVREYALTRAATEHRDYENPPPRAHFDHGLECV